MYSIDVLSETGRGGVFETIRVYNEKAFRLNEHLSRLKESCVSAGISLKLSREALKNRIEKYLRENKVQDASFRITVIRKKDGYGRFGFLLRDLHRYPDCIYQRGVKVITSVLRRNIPTAVEGRIKADEFLGGVLARAEKKDDIFETIWLNQTGYITEGTVNNIFIVKEGILKTPPLFCGVLRGITRQVILEITCRINLRYEEVLLTRHDLYNADEAFFTNTNINILPIL